MNKVKILAFAGSTRKDSFNKKLIRNAIAGAEKQGAEVILIDLADYPMPLYDRDLEAEHGVPENAQKIKILMKECDGFMISTPEYNSGLPAVLKNAIDWASRLEKGEMPLECFKGKTAILMSASPGRLGGLRSLYKLRNILMNLMVMVIPDNLAVFEANKAFDDSGILVDEKQKQLVEGLGKKLVEITQKLNA